MELERPKPKQKKKKEKSEPINIVSPVKYADPESNLSQSADISRELQIAAQESFDESRLHIKHESITSSFSDIERISLEGSFKSLDIQSIPNTSETDGKSSVSCEEIFTSNEQEKEANQEIDETDTYNEEIVPSVPPQEMEENTNKEYNKLLDKNKEIVNSILLEETQINNEINPAIKEQIKTKVVEEVVEIRAYTETQLAGLYTNVELQMIEKFNQEFIEAELRGLGVKKHILYEMLDSYLSSLNKLTETNLELENLEKDYRHTLDNLWSLETLQASAIGICQDNHKVKATQSYNKATFHRSTFQAMTRILGSYRETLHESYTLHSYSSQVYKQQIELYLQILIDNCLCISKIDLKAPVNMTMENAPAFLIPVLTDLRLSISSLFAFQRKLVKNTNFIKETRDWLGKVIAVFLRIANWQDHLFLINHILRCPPGIGSWATQFVQLPLKERSEENPFSNSEINHVVSILAVILMPIQEREKFLYDISQTNETGTEPLWVVVDSSGEEDEDSSGTSLRENDLVGLFNQLPLDQLFRTILSVQKQNGEYVYDPKSIKEQHILRLFAFKSALLRILSIGIKTYDQIKYHQFTKRLCRLIRHTVQYATDVFEAYNLHINHCIKENLPFDQAMFKRLQIEYDAFFLRATYTLFTSQKKGAWQFLAIVPYHKVSLKILQKIYYMLHDSTHDIHKFCDPNDNTNYGEKLLYENITPAFEDTLNNLDDAEVYYLLNTFANMALARNYTEDEEIKFIESVARDLLYTGFINENTRDMCSKNVRILLTHITSKWPLILSKVLNNVYKNMGQINSLAFYLYEELPLTIWKLQESDFNILSKLLIDFPIDSCESQLARMIISRLNWNYEELGDLNESMLFLPYNLHVNVALLALKAADKEPGCTQWAWQTLYRLKLHICDKGNKNFGLIKEPIDYEIISKGLNEQQPSALACFASILMTSYGHLVPLICTKGLPLILQLAEAQKFDAVIFALNFIVPIFVECQEVLVNNEVIQAILMTLLNADRGYVNMAKNLVVSQTLVLKNLANMIESQVCNFAWYGLSSPRCLVRIWINTLVSLPNWNRDCGIMHLLDILLRCAYFYPDTIDVVINTFKDLLQCASPQEQNSISSLFKWVSQSNNQGNLINSSLSNCSWLAYVMINLEFEEKEKQTGLWKEIQIQLRNQKGKVNVDSAIKKAASVVKVPAFTSGNLSIFRWAQQALDTPLNHPLLALLWQKFFILYLARVPVTTAVDVGCVGAKFFEGLINLTFMKRLKKRLQESVEYFKNLLETEEAGDNQQKKSFYEISLRLYQAYSLWLEEPRLQESSIFLPNLPQQYEPQLLSLLIQGNTAPWTEYINYGVAKEEQQMALKGFKSANFRDKSKMNLPLLSPGSSMESEDPIERILRRLSSYDYQKSPPSIVKTAPLLPPLNLTTKQALFDTLNPSIQILKKYSHDYGISLAEHKVLDCTYVELLPQLYRTVVQNIKKQVPCKGHNQTVNCSGPAIIQIQIQDARINEKIEHQINLNRKQYESKLNNILQLPPKELCIAAVTIKHAIRILQTDQTMNELGVELFYYILSLINEETVAFLPTKQLFASCLEKLGQTHIYGVENEAPRLLHKILEDPSLGVYLAPHFCPIDISTPNFLHMYSTVSRDIGQRFDVVFTLLSKFDVSRWLRTQNPKLSQRSQFIDLVIKALTQIGHEPAVNSLPLHGVYRKHLLSVFEYQFPEHFGEILMNVLKASNAGTETNCVSVSVWLDLLNFLAQPIVFKQKNVPRDLLRQYAQQQRLLQHQELLETANLLSRHFTQERFQYGLYGLYPKTRVYIDVFTLFVGMTGHALIISALNTHQGLLGDKLCELIWPYLRDMFAPWIFPYLINNVKDNMANWIQQLADDRTVLLPWIPADGPFAQKAVHMFFECIQFLIQTLPGCNNILSFVWHMYVTNFAHTSVKEYILNVIHSSFLDLPWRNFWPSISDLELMLRVVDQYLPECHVFLGYIFIEVNWRDWLSSLSESTPQHIKARIHQCLLNLLVKLSNEPNIRNNHMDKITTLIVYAESFNWSLIDANMFQQIMDWYLQSCDPLVIFKTDPMNLDFRVIHLLKCVASYDKALTTNYIENLKKRHIFVRSLVKLVGVFTNKHKSLIPSKEKELIQVMSLQLTHVEQVVQSHEEFNVILTSLLEVLNLQCVNQACSTCFQNWIANKSSNSLPIRSILQTLSNAVNDKNAAAELLEATILAYFTNNVDNQQVSWDKLCEILTPFNPTKQAELENVLVSKGCFLSLHALFLKRMTSCTDYGLLLNLCLEWMSNLKITESTEPKIPLLWADFISVSEKYTEINEAGSGAALHKFSQLLLQISDEKDMSKWGRGLLGAIGIIKQTTISQNFKFLSRALAGYILAQLPEMKGNPQNVRRRNSIGSAVGQPGGNSECAKVLLRLDFGEKQGKIKDYAEIALKQIQDPANTLHEANKFLSFFVSQIFLKPYLK